MDDSRKKRLRRVMMEQETGPMLMRRWLGCWIDLAAAAALLFAPFVPLSAEWGAAVGVTLVFAYFIVCEGVWGRTLGKLASGLVIVSDQGYPPGFLRAFLRTLTRPIEVNPAFLGGVPAGFVVMMTKKKQRLGDMLAGTYVLPLSELKRFERMDVEIFE